MRSLVIAALATATVSLAAQNSAPNGGLALASFGNLASLQVRSAAFAANEALPHPYSAYGENFSPALVWQGAPASTKSFVVLMEDPDAQAPAPTPFVHWVLFNLPASTSSLHESVPTHPRLPAMGNAQQGKNSRGTVGYFGPRPPAGDAAHHYHFEVLALDTMLQVPPGATKEQLMPALAGHVLAAGETIGQYAR